MNGERRAPVTRGSVRAVLLLALTACAGASTGGGGAGTTPVSTADVQDDARLLAMFDARRPDPELLHRLMASPVATRRARAALVAGQIGARAAFPRLRQLLVDADTAVAANAAYALGLAKDSASILALGRALAGAPDAVAREAAWALGEIGEPARTVIAFALGDGSSNARASSTAALRAPIVRAELLTATAKLRAVPAAWLSPWLDDSADVVARAAAYAIARPRVPGTLRAMLAVRNHRDELVRQHVARALTAQAAGDSLGARAREALVAFLGDSSPRVRANAARSIATYGPAMRAEYERATSDRDANVRVAAAEGVATVYARDAAAWRQGWARDTTYMVRRSLLAAARRAGVDALAEGERAWSAATDFRLRIASLEAAAAAPNADRTVLGTAALRDADGRVRAAGAGILFALPPRNGNDGERPRVERRPQATGLLQDPDEGVRASAANEIARDARAGDVAALLDAYERGARDVDTDARAAALRGLAAAWERDSAAFTADGRARLAALPMPSAPALRSAGARITPLAAWRANPASDLRPLAEYERIVRRWWGPGARMPQATIRTDRGDIVLELLASEAPLVVDAFIGLAQRGLYRNTRWHRVVPNFVAQDGDPRGDGSGGAGFALRDAYTRVRHDRGCLGLATSGPDTGGSQYYLCHSPQPHLDGHYTVFGRVRSGFEAMDAIVQGDRVIAVEIR